MAQANRSAAPEMNYALSDYGLRSRPDLKHVCGRYELRADGKLLTWDLFATERAPGEIKNEVDDELRRYHERDKSRSARRDISVVVNSSSKFEWPRGCSKTVVANAQSVLVASRVL